MWRSGDNFLESFLSFNHVGPRDQALRLGSKDLHPLSRLTGSRVLFVTHMPPPPVNNNNNNFRGSYLNPTLVFRALDTAQGSEKLGERGRFHGRELWCSSKLPGTHIKVEAELRPFIDPSLSLSLA